MVFLPVFGEMLGVCYIVRALSVAIRQQDATNQTTSCDLLCKLLETNCVSPALSKSAKA